MRRGPERGKPDPSRNVYYPRGREVTVDDVKAHALPKHQKCKGGMVSKTTPCSCATKRFLKAHPEVIIDSDGRAWWPAKDPILDD